MKYRLFLLFCALNFTASVNSQELMSVNGGKQYKATTVWNFLCERYSYDHTLEVQIAKTEKGGILKLSIEVIDSNKNIAGRVYMILENGDYIYCSDKGQREFKDGTSTSYYYLTPKEMAKMKHYNIQDVRFTIAGQQNTFGKLTGYFTATNKKQIIDPFDKSDNTLDTKSAFVELLR